MTDPSNTPLDVYNALAQLPAALAHEAVEVLASGRNVRIERIVSHGHASPPGFWYEQDEHEWVIVMAGGATIAFADETSIDLRPGDHVLLPARVRHRVERTASSGATVWIAVFYR